MTVTGGARGVRAVLAATVCGGLLAAGTACSSAPSAPTLTGVRVATVSAEAAILAPSGTLRDRDLGELDGPHYTLGLSWIVTGQDVTGQNAVDLGVSPVEAPPGQQLTTIAIDPSVNSAPFHPTQPIPVQLVVDGKATDLPGLPLTDSSPAQSPKTDVILIAAAPSSTLLLRATDDGRTQQLDLRTGRTSGPHYTQQDTTFSTQPPVTTTATVAGTDDSGQVTLSLLALVPDSAQQADQSAEVAITDYQEGIGWAPAGQAFLTMALPGLSCTQQTGLGMLCLLCSARFDDPAAFSFTPTGGSAVPADPGDAQVAFTSLPAEQALATVVFRVPAATTGGTVTWNLAAAQLVEDQSDSAHWSAPPRPLAIPVSFNGK